MFADKFGIVGLDVGGVDEGSVGELDVWVVLPDDGLARYVLALSVQYRCWEGVEGRG